jgi:putative flippase GtrA
LLNNAIVIGMDQAGYHYAVSVAVAFLVVMLVGYRLHASYTFEVEASRGGWLRFLLVNLSGFPLSIALMFVLCDGVGLSASLAMPIATVLLFAWNYVLAHRVIAGQARPGQ